MFDMAASPCIQCRIDPQLKLRLQAIAVERGLSESAVLKHLAKRHFAIGGNGSPLIYANKVSRRMQPSARCAASHEFQKQIAFFALMSATRPPTCRRSLVRILVAIAINRSRVR